MEWPPAYQIRRSRRARRVGVSITPAKGLELVLPLRASVKDGLIFLDSKRAWVEKHLLTLLESTANEKTFPTDVCLTALNLELPIRYHHLPHSKKVSLQRINQRLVFTGKIETFDVCLPAFDSWLRRIAKEYLPRCLDEVSQDIQLPYSRVSVRSQKTLWGSCSHEKAISLNDRLLFLPYELVRYILIHELCHTVYFGHGKRFWQLVKRFDPNYLSHERRLRDVSCYIPSYFRS